MSQTEVSPNWQDPLIRRWLAPMVKESTRSAYQTAFRLYLQFTGMSPKELVDEAILDFQRPLDQKTDVVKARLREFHQWLQTRSARRVMAKGGKYVASDRGHSQCTAFAYHGAVRSFYATFGVTVKFRRCEQIPSPRVANPRYPLSNVDVKRLLDHSNGPRDRAIILTMFQSGMDVSTLCSLTYGQLRRGLETNEVPLKVDCYRQKAGTTFYTFLGRDAIESVKAYVSDYQYKGTEFRDDSPLFQTNLFKDPTIGHGIRAIHVENSLRRTAIKAGFVKEEQVDRYHPCPVNPHGLREAFSGIMLNRGVPRPVVDFWLGHKLDRLADTYMRPRLDEVRQLYIQNEPFISVSQSTQLVQEVKEKANSLEMVVADLSLQNRDLRERMDRLIQVTEALQFRINLTEGLDRTARVAVEGE